MAMERGTSSAVAMAIADAKSVGQSIVSGSTAAVALAAASTLLVGGVSYAVHEYKQSKDKKWLEKIEEVLKIHQRFLTRFSEDNLSLPPPFELEEKGDPKKPLAYKFLKLTPQVRRDLIEDRSINNDAFLLDYSRHIKTAKMQIRTYYDDRLTDRTIFSSSSENDVTSGVLTYLLVMLTDHCTKFEGYNADIAILNGIIRFTNAYASIPRKGALESRNPKKRVRFERLKLVCIALRKARKLLMHHKKSRTIKSHVDELMTACDKEFIPGLSTIFAKFITPERLWSSVDTAPSELLATGDIRPVYQNTHHFLRLPEPVVSIPESIFKEWLKNLMAFTINPRTVIKARIQLLEEHMPQIKELFKHCPNFLNLKAPQALEDGRFASDRFVPVGYDEECQLQTVSKMPTTPLPNSFLLCLKKGVWTLYEIGETWMGYEINLNEVDGLENALAALPKRALPESLTRTQKSPLNKILTRYRNHCQLKARAQIFTDLATLLDQLTDLKEFCKTLSDCIRDLGEIYVRNPQNCNFIFDTLKVLFRDMDDRIAFLLKAIEKVGEEQDRANDMMIEGQLDLALQLPDQLDVIRLKISRNIGRMLDMHHGHNKILGKPEQAGFIDCEAKSDAKQTDKEKEMLSKSRYIVQKYKIGNGKYELTPSKSDSDLERKSSDDDKKEEKFHSISPGRQASEEKERTDLARHRRVYSFVSDKASLDEALPSIAALKEPEYLLNLIRARLEAIYIDPGERVDTKTRKAYESLYKALDVFDLKWKVMDKEEPKHRKAKARNIKKVTYNLCKSTLEFLNKTREQRIHEANHFTDQVLPEQFSASKNDFLDEHKSLRDRLLQAAKELGLCLVVGYGFYRAYQRGGFFKTDSRALCHRVKKSSVILRKRLGEPPSAG